MDTDDLNPVSVFLAIVSAKINNRAEREQLVELSKRIQQLEDDAHAVDTNHTETLLGFLAWTYGDD